MLDMRRGLIAYLRLHVRCGASCLLALFVALSVQESNEERGASKQLAPQCGASCLLALFLASFDQGLIRKEARVNNSRHTVHAIANRSIMGCAVRRRTRP